MIQVWVNDKKLLVTAGITLTALLEKEGLLTPIATVAVNGRLLPRREWSYSLREGDRVEVVSMMAGG